MPLIIVWAVKEKTSVFDGFRCYIINSYKDIIGPITPTLAGPSFHNVPSCHAEVGAIKLAISLGKNLQKCKIICIRWIYDKITKEWLLDNCIPCSTCIKFMKKHKINKIYISKKRIFNANNKEVGIIKVNISDLEKLTKPSTGSLYSNK